MSLWHSVWVLRGAVAGIVAVASLLALASPASAGPTGYTLRFGVQLNRVDLTTLELEPVGEISDVRAFYLAFHADGTLYGLSWLDTSWMQLSSFDLATGAGQVVADLHLDFEFIPFGFAGHADGGLWAAGILFVGEEFVPAILAIDPGAGAAGAPVEIIGLGEKAFPTLAACGDLLVTSGAWGLAAVDPLTGGTTVLFPEAPPASGMDRGPDGAIWAVDAGEIVFGEPTVFRRLDLATGEITTSGEVSPSIGGLAIAPPTGGQCLGNVPLSIPTLSPLALVALAVSIAGAALWIARRRPRLARSSLVALVVALAALAPIAPAASADPIAYSLQGPNLNRVDLATLEGQLVGPTGGVSASLLAFHAGGTLYGLAQTDPDSLRLVSYDLATGAGEVLADLDLPFTEFSLQGFAGDGGGGLWVLGRRPDAGGTIRAVIFEVDPAGGPAGEPVEISGESYGFEGLAACGDQFVSLGLLGLHGIDPRSGRTTLLFRTAWTVDDMDVGPDGGLWFLDTLPISVSGSGLGIFQSIHRLDLTTGELAFFGTLLGADGLAIAPPTGGSCLGVAPAIPAIPALPPLGLVALAVTIAAAGLGIARRRA